MKHRGFLNESMKRKYEVFPTFPTFSLVRSGNDDYKEYVFKGPTLKLFNCVYTIRNVDVQMTLC